MYTPNKAGNPSSEFGPFDEVTFEYRANLHMKTRGKCGASCPAAVKYILIRGDTHIAHQDKPYLSL